MNNTALGKILHGDEAAIQAGINHWLHQPVDLIHTSEGHEPIPLTQRTIAGPSQGVVGDGTFSKGKRTIIFEPYSQPGWYFDRSDLPDCLPVRVSVRNVWTTGQIVSNIVLRSGPENNYIRMVEHIIALKLGMGIDNLLIRIDSGDPPLFDRSSMDLVEAIEQAGIEDLGKPARLCTVKEPVTVGSGTDSFLTFLPASPDNPQLTLDCAVAFKTAIGKQRIQFPVTYDLFREGAFARTNTPSWKKYYCQTIGRLFADVRNLGYTNENILIAGRKKYKNEPRLIHEGKSLEAAWHRSALDLLAAIALIEDSRFVGHVISYKAGHRLDVEMIRQLYQQDLLTELIPSTVQSAAPGGRIKAGTSLS